MKKNLLLLAGLLTVMTFSFTACSDDDEEGEGGNNEQKLVGLWINNATGDNLVCIELKSDGKLTRYTADFKNHAFDEDEIVNGTWYNPSKKVLNITLGISYDLEYKLKDKNQTLVIDDGHSELEFHKVEGYDIDAVRNMARLCGAWYRISDTNVVEYVFYYLDGTAYDVTVHYESDGKSISSCDVAQGTWKWDSEKGVFFEKWSSNEFYFESTITKTDLKQHDIYISTTYNFKRTDPLLVQNLILKYQ